MKLKQKRRTYLDDLDHLLPLLLARVDAGRVVRAALQQDHVPLRDPLQVLDARLEVEAARLRPVVAVGLDLEARVAEDRVVVAPGGRGQPDHLFAIMKQHINIKNVNSKN